MDEREELELGKLIASALPETPPDDIARGVTPWRRAISETVWGLVLCMVTLGEGILKYAMPFAGALLLLCGTRTLRRENAGFAAVGHHFGSNGSAFDHRAFGSEVAL